jgi:hypothetical protein
MAHNEQVAEHVVEIAGRRMHDDDPEVRPLAGEVMRLSLARSQCHYTLIKRANAATRAAAPAR